jgi:hypothetical protein
MEKTFRPPHELTDQRLLEELPRLARVEEHAACVLVAHLVEMDRRQLDRAAGFNSIYDYCVNGLGLSEDAAYNRMAATRVARKFPLALELLISGALRLTALRLLEKVLTEANHREVLEAARQKSKREVELLIAEIAPRPDVPERAGRRAVRLGPQQKAGAASGTPVLERHPPPVREAGTPVRERASREGDRPTTQSRFSPLLSGLCFLRRPTQSRAPLFFAGWSKGTPFRNDARAGPRPRSRRAP